MSRPLKFKNAADWRAVKATQGWDIAGRPRRGAYVSMPESPPSPSPAGSQGRSRRWA
jgi:hypothetical protein